MSNLILTRDVGCVESMNMTENLQTYSIKSPIDSHQTYAEVEKVAYKISQLIKSWKYVIISQARDMQV